MVYIDFSLFPFCEHADDRVNYDDTAKGSPFHERQ